MYPGVYAFIHTRQLQTRGHRTRRGRADILSVRGKKNRPALLLSVLARVQHVGTELRVENYCIGHQYRKHETGGCHAVDATLRLRCYGRP